MMTTTRMKKVPIVVFVIIVLLVLTQIGWWIYFQLEQNKSVFQMHQAVLSMRVKEAVTFINRTFESNLMTYTIHTGADHGHPESLLNPDDMDIPAGHFLCVGDTVYYNANGRGVIEATVKWVELNRSVAQTYPELLVERMPQTTAGVYRHGPARHVRLPILVRPRTEFFAQIIDEAEGKSLMFTSEGVFLSLMVLIGVYVIFILMRKELAVESRQKNFILSITHELKSPLASIKLYLQTMLTKNVPEPKRVNFLAHSVTDIERLERLVDNMLETARLDSGDYVLRKEKIQFSSLIKQTAEGMKNQLDEEGAQIDLNLADDVWIDGDQHALMSVIGNVVGNAAKYATAPKRIEVSLRVESSDAVVQISDNGPGIAEEDRPHIFDRFYRSGDEMTRRSKGTGLGLFLVKQLVDAHHGEIKVLNKPDSGACFEIRFPTVVK